MKCYILPGAKEKVNRNHSQLLEILQNNNIVPVGVDINWRDYSFQKYLKEASKKLNEATQEDLILGFSYGAIIAALYGNSTTPHILCSTSPVYKKNIKKRNATRKAYDKILDFQINWEQLDEMEQTFYNNFKQLNNKSILMASTNENTDYYEFAQILSKDNKLTFISVEEANHNMTHPLYLKGIEKAIKKVIN